MNAIAIIGARGPSLPVSIRGARLRATEHAGKADPIWDTAFDTKFPRNKPQEDAPFVTPKGALNVIRNFLDRVEEINWLASTQHQELATTMAEMRANGVASASLTDTEGDLEAANIAASHLNQTPYAPDAVYAANMQRRIDWERFVWACGPVHRARFVATRDKTLGIAYEGAAKDADFILTMKRALKNAWLDRFEALPDLHTVEQAHEYASYYGKIVLARMTEAQLAEHRASRMFGNEDPDPGRIEFHALNPRTAVFVPDEDDRDEFGTLMGALITDDLPGGIVDIGYAGPKGFLGLDEDAE